MTYFKFSSTRNFLTQASYLGTITVSNASPLNIDVKVGDHHNFLFQGDSITDGNRSRNQDKNALPDVELVIM